MVNQLLVKYASLKLKNKLFLIALLLLVIFGPVYWRTSRCTVDVDTVPIQIIYIEADPVTTFSKADINSTLPGFSAFMTTVTKHLTAKLSQERICLNNDESKERSLIQFAPRPINSERDPIPSVPPLSGRSSGGCRITSPWMELVIERKLVPSVRGIFIYSERQLLVDQALLAGAHNVPPGVAMPLTYEEFKRYADFEYAPSEIHHQAAEKPIEERVPPDLLWLFQRAGHDPRYDLSGLAGSSMRLAMRVCSKSYTQIVTSLIDRCFESDGEDIHYDSILDLDDPALLEQYKLDAPLISMPE